MEDDREAASAAVHGARSCRQCRKAIRSDSRQAIHLWNTPDGAAWVCGQRCLDKFNEGEDVTAQALKDAEDEPTENLEAASDALKKLVVESQQLGLYDQEE